MRYGKDEVFCPVCPSRVYSSEELDEHITRHNKEAEETLNKLEPFDERMVEIDE